MTNNEFLNKMHDILLNTCEVELKTNNIEKIINALKEVFLKKRSETSLAKKIKDEISKLDNFTFWLDGYYFCLILIKLFDLSLLDCLKYDPNINLYYTAINDKFDFLVNKFEFNLSQLSKKSTKLLIPIYNDFLVKDEINIYIDVKNTKNELTYKILDTFLQVDYQTRKVNAEPKVNFIIDKSIKKIEIKTFEPYYNYIKNIFFYPEEDENGDLQTPFEIYIEDEELYKLLKPINV